MKKKIILSLISIFVCGSALANGAFLPRSFKAEFAQKIESSITGESKDTSGTIDYLHPSNIKFDVLKPQPMTIVSNKQKTWTYTPPFFDDEPGEVTITDTSKNVMSRFFDLLKLGLKTNNYYSVEKKKDSYFLKFEPRTQKDISIKEVTLYFSKNKPVEFKNISRIDFLDTENTKKTFELKNLVINPKFSKEYFTFTPPKNTTITQ